MVEVTQKIVITGLICLCIIYLVTLFTEHDTTSILIMLSGLIGLITGVVIPAPKADSKGVLRW